MNKLPDPGLPWPICMDGVALVAEAEGCRLKAYKCPAGIWTCGWGETDGVTPTTVWTQEHADQRFCDSLTERTHQVLALCTLHPTDNQLAAMVSLSYNTGMAGFAQSSVLKAHNRGDHQSASRAFGLWNKAKVGGVLTVLAGLTARRAAESALYLKPEPEEAPAAMPQAVQAESRIAASPTVQAGTAATITGAIAIVGQAGDQVAAVGATIKAAKSLFTETLGIPADWFLPLVLVIGGAVVLYNRAKQRSGGWA